MIWTVVTQKAGRCDVSGTRSLCAQQLLAESVMSIKLRLECTGKQTVDHATNMPEGSDAEHVSSRFARDTTTSVHMGLLRMHRRKSSMPTWERHVILKYTSMETISDDRHQSSAEQQTRPVVCGHSACDMHADAGCSTEAARIAHDPLGHVVVVIR